MIFQKSNKAFNVTLIEDSPSSRPIRDLQHLPYRPARGICEKAVEIYPPFETIATKYDKKNVTSRI